MPRTRARHCCRSIAPAHYTTTTISSGCIILRWSIHDRARCVRYISLKLPFTSRNNSHQVLTLSLSARRWIEIVWRAQYRWLRGVDEKRCGCDNSCDLSNYRAIYRHVHHIPHPPHSPFSHLFTFAETLKRILTNTVVMGLVETTTDARMYILVGPMGGARDGNVAVRSSRRHGLADWWLAVLVRAAARQPSWLKLVAAGWGVIRQGRTRCHFGRPPHYKGLNHAHLPLLSFL